MGLWLSIVEMGSDDDVVEMDRELVDEAVDVNRVDKDCFVECDVTEMLVGDVDKICVAVCEVVDWLIVAIISVEVDTFELVDCSLEEEDSVGLEPEDKSGLVVEIETPVEIVPVEIETPCPELVD